MTPVPDPMNLDFTFGKDFNYGSWDINTVLTLTNVKWDNTYRDIWLNKTQKKMNEYIDSRPTANTKIVGVSQANLNKPIKINTPFNRASLYNYIRASNPVQPGIDDVQRDYYYFIIGVTQIAGNTTELTVQLDLWATYGRETKFGNCYVSQGHIGIANEKAFNHYGRDFLTKPEGLDVGGEYLTKSVVKVDIMNVKNATGFNILVASTVDLQASPFDSTGKPRVPTAKGGTFSGLPSGATYYIFKDSAAFKAYMAANTDYPWMTQGIISIKVIPKIKRYLPGYNEPSGSINYAEAPSEIPPAISYRGKQNWRDTVPLIPARYAHLKKFLTYPYTIVEMTTWSGTPVVLKPESWNDDHASIREMACLVPPMDRVTFSPMYYNSNINQGLGGNNGPGDDDQGEYLDITTVINNFPTLALVNSGAIAFMASNSGSLAYGAASADWSQQKALQGASTSYDQASSGINLARQLGNNSINNDYAQTTLNNQTAAGQAGLSAVQNIGQGLANGGVGVIGGSASAAAGLASAAIQQGANNASFGLRNSLANSNMDASAGNAAYVQDTNNNLAQFSAKGDYQNAIAGISAKTQDARMIQPSTVGQVGGDTMNLLHDNTEVSLRFKTIDRSAQTTIGEYWLRYGYNVSQFARITDLMVMSKFTYWKLQETYIETALMPEGFKQAIRGIFEKGVTVWANPDDIGMIDWADNVPLEGFSL